MSLVSALDCRFLVTTRFTQNIPQIKQSFSCWLALNLKYRFKRARLYMGSSKGFLVVCVFVLRGPDLIILLFFVSEQAI